MQKILKYLEENYNTEISKKDIEEIFFYSHRNSQRLFKRFFNETISSFQKRIKLDSAYKRLVYTSDSIKNIAYDVGYQNQSSFNIAFKKQFDITPCEARLTKDILFKTFIENSTEYHNKIDFELVYLQSKIVFCKQIITHSYNNQTINNLWDEISEHNFNSENINYYGLILDQPLISKPCKCRYEACVDANLNNTTYLPKTIFGRKYLKFIHIGDYDLIDDTYRQIYFNWIGFLDFEIDNSPIIEHYIVNDNDTTDKSEYQTEILIPLK